MWKHKVSTKEYFSEKYRDYISNSKLSHINPEEDGSPEKFKEGFSNEYNPSFEVGSAVHAMLLQPDEYEISTIRKPTGKLGAFAEFVFNYRRKGLTIVDAIEQASLEANYYIGKLSPKRLQTAIKTSLPFYLQRIHFKEDPIKVPLFLSEPNFIKVDAGITNAEKHKDFMSYLNPDHIFIEPLVFNEYAVLCEVNILDENKNILKTVKVKGKFDNVTIDLEMGIVSLNDVKTTGQPSAWFMGNHHYVDKVWIPGAFERYRYYRQVAMYLWLLQSYVKVQYPDNQFTYRSNILIIETIPEYNVRVCNISNNWITKGVDEFKNLLILAANEY